MPERLPGVALALLHIARPPTTAPGDPGRRRVVHHRHRYRYRDRETGR